MQRGTLLATLLKLVRQKKLREFRLFAKDKTKAARMKLTSAMANIASRCRTDSNRH